jgi:predicted dinucleotide-binding enzyme
MKVGVLGSGDVAKALADGFAKHGHHVVMGTRDTSKLSHSACCGAFRASSGMTGLMRSNSCARNDGHD